MVSRDFASRGNGQGGNDVYGCGDFVPGKHAAAKLQDLLRKLACVPVFPMGLPLENDVSNDERAGNCVLSRPN
jgi:hypothetical protein